jgi:hypothetical protein
LRSGDVPSDERFLCDVTTGAVTKLTLAAEVVSEIYLSPDGKEIAYVGGARAKDQGVWMLENFLPLKEGKATQPKKQALSDHRWAPFSKVPKSTSAGPRRVLAPAPFARSAA